MKNSMCVQYQLVVHCTISIGPCVIKTFLKYWWQLLSGPAIHAVVQVVIWHRLPSSDPPDISGSGTRSKMLRRGSVVWYSTGNCSRCRSNLISGYTDPLMCTSFFSSGVEWSPSDSATQAISPFASRHFYFGDLRSTLTNPSKQCP